MNNTNTLSISELRQHATEAVDSVSKKQEPTVIFKRSQPKAVLVDINYFQALEEAVLDLTDSYEAEKAKTEDKTPFSTYLKKRWGKTRI